MTRLRIGVRVPCYRRWCRREEARAIAQTAEELGFDSLWVQDHLVAPVGDDAELRVEQVDPWMDPASAAREPAQIKDYYAADDWWLDPYVTWGFLAGVTERVQLASDIIVIPYRNPVVQAKMIGTLDVLSGGRMIVGTGTGHVQAESEAIGVPYEARGRAHDEGLRVIRALLSKPEASFDGELTSFGRVRSLIRPVQRPYPPIYVGGNAPRSIRRAVELGDGWLPTSPTPAGLERGVALLHEACERAGRAVPPTVGASIPGNLRFATPSLRAGRRPTTTVGEAIDLLTSYAEAGAEHVALGFAMPTADVYLEQIELFAAEVLPAVR
ncbi:MAG TPA: TIGR03619 family F420-dependent LLM class oxidoreductase [Acidimicrobiales bacterium]|jgi:probable F420-dependent oxidoreductase|nr:TIGR03619 family F420-dependent LLM class oxidoreductase [Acidimicrobiales bacterium]